MIKYLLLLVVVIMALGLLIKIINFFLYKTHMAYVKKYLPLTNPLPANVKKRLILEIYRLQGRVFPRNLKIDNIIERIENDELTDEDLVRLTRIFESYTQIDFRSNYYRM